MLVDYYACIEPQARSVLCCQSFMFLESWARFLNSRGGSKEEGSCNESSKVASR